VRAIKRELLGERDAESPDDLAGCGIERSTHALPSIARLSWMRAARMFPRCRVDLTTDKERLCAPGIVNG
jgi:hypothetical protein